MNTIKQTKATSSYIANVSASTFRAARSPATRLAAPSNPTAKGEPYYDPITLLTGLMTALTVTAFTVTPSAAAPRKPYANA